MGYPLEHRTEDRRADDANRGHGYDDDMPAGEAGRDEPAAGSGDEFGAEPELVRPYTDRDAAGVGPDDVAQGRAHVRDEVRADVAPGEDATTADEVQSDEATAIRPDAADAAPMGTAPAGAASTGAGPTGQPSTSAASVPAATVPAPTTPSGDGALWDADATQRYRDRWRDLQIGFVDDPAGAVQRARALVDEVTDEFRSAVSRRLASPGGTADGDTEQQRTALRAYREVFDRLLG